ncbi:MAG: diguanylate cyclase [Lachnospiraceae bacterium]|nr:diguanylate cyclase [Lachnospiraceae bacterium]
MKNWIVVVDDEAMSLTSARTMLASEDMKVSCLPSGKSLLKFLEKNSPDLVLLDVIMPEMNGFQTIVALRELEKKQNKPQIPVIFLTGESDHEAEQNGLKLGAADYIHKPFNRDILISRIRNTIDNSRKIESLTEDATKDALTGFLNKAQGVARIKEVLSTNSGALLMVDLDSFKLVNDLYGHEMGDKVLRGFSQLAKASTREDDILCRIGGDEFLFYCSGLHGDAALAALSSRLNEKLEIEAAMLMGSDHGIPLGISIGAVMVPEYGTDYDELFKLADEAMYQTKQNGKHGFTIYEDARLFQDQNQNLEEEISRTIKIMEERNQGTEALMLGADAFSTVFRFIERFNSRFDGRALILLFIVLAKTSGGEAVLNDASVSFGEVLKKTLEKSDIILQRRINQFFVLIPLIEQTGADSIIGKIMSAWKEGQSYEDIEIKTASQIR